MICLIIATEMGGKTARYFDKIGMPYKYVACECQKEAFDADKTIFYKHLGWHGCAVARRAALEVKDSVVFDDDYSALQGGGIAETTVDNVQFRDGDFLFETLEKIKKIEEKYPKLILGGYSAGALHGVRNRFSANIMQVFFGGKITKFFRNDGDMYRLDDDVCACIMAKRRGYLTLGLWSIMRAIQTPEGEDNTNNYDSRSWSKSFLPILYAPTAARVVWCRPKKLAGGRIRPGRFHHKIEWAKISPCVIEKS